MRRTGILILLLILLHLGDAFAQDPQFSQYFASPMTLNPALTGNIEGSFRVAGNYRQQWWGVGDPFNTATISFEKRILEGRLSEYDRLGVGVMAMTDNSLSGGLKSTYLSFSAAFQKGLGENHRLGVGFQGTYGNRVVDYSRLSFYNQFDRDGFNLSLPSGENALASLKSYLDANMGLLYNYEDETKLIYAGFSYFHLNKPKQSVLGTDNRIQPRYTVHAGGSFLSGAVLRITVHALYQQQNKANSMSVGGAVGYDMGESGTFYLGSWYRFNDAFYPYISYAKSGLQVGVSFDMVTSGIKQALRKNGSIELSVIYSKPNDTFERRAMPWYY